MEIDIVLFLTKQHIDSEVTQAEGTLHGCGVSQPSLTIAPQTHNFLVHNDTMLSKNYA